MTWRDYLAAAAFGALFFAFGAACILVSALTGAS